MNWSSVETERRKKRGEKRREIVGVARSAPVTFFRGTRVQERRETERESFLTRGRATPRGEQRSGRTKPGGGKRGGTHREYAATLT